jgi:hypothetical protein
VFSFIARLSVRHGGQSTDWAIYRLADGDVYVMMVIDSRRNAEDLLLERFTR